MISNKQTVEIEARITLADEQPDQTNNEPGQEATEPKIERPQDRPSR